jgi:hypothetical protein
MLNIKTFTLEGSFETTPVAVSGFARSERESHRGGHCPTTPATTMGPQTTQ